jgi:hypothetical protein
MRRTDARIERLHFKIASRNPILGSLEPPQRGDLSPQELSMSLLWIQIPQNAPGGRRPRRSAAGQPGASTGKRLHPRAHFEHPFDMGESKSSCPHCGIPMEEVPVKAEPNANPKVAAQPLDDIKAGVVVTRLECPQCHHAEGRLPKGKETWKDAQGESAG